MAWNVCGRLESCTDTQYHNTFSSFNMLVFITENAMSDYQGDPFGVAYQLTQDLNRAIQRVLEV